MEGGLGFCEKKFGLELIRLLQKTKSWLFSEVKLNAGKVKGFNQESLDGAMTSAFIYWSFHLLVIIEWLFNKLTVLSNDHFINCSLQQLVISSTGD
jgi:hypothetical protein